MKKLRPGLLVILLLSSFYSVPASAAHRHHFTDRSLLFLGASSNSKDHIENIKEINTALCTDIRNVLGSDITFSDLSAPYLYSRHINLVSIARTRRVRWIIHGDAAAHAGGLFEITVALFDAKSGKDCVSRSFKALSSEDALISYNMKFLYSEIAGANNFFIKTHTHEKKIPHAVAVTSLFSDGSHRDAAKRFTRSIKTWIASRSSNMLTQPSEKLMRYIDFLSCSRNSRERLDKISKALHVSWIITGSLETSQSGEDEICTLSLFSAEHHRIEDSFSMQYRRSDSFTRDMQLYLENFLLIISAHDHYFLHRQAEPPLRVERASRNRMQNSVFRGSDLLLSGNTAREKPGDQENEVRRRKTESDAAGRTAESIRCDTKGNIYRMDRSKKKILAADSSGQSVREFSFTLPRPSGFAVTLDRTVFIASTRSGQIEVYSRTGVLIRHIKISGADSLTLLCPGGRPAVLTVNRGYYRIIFMNTQGLFIKSSQTGISSKLLSADLSAMDASGRLYCFDKKRQLLFCISRERRIDWIRLFKENASPVSLDVNADGSRMVMLDAKRGIIILTQSSSDADNGR